MLTTAASDGWNVETTVSQLVTGAPLGRHDPATELRYRVLNSVGAGSLDTVPAVGGDGMQSMPRADEPFRAAADTQPPGFAR